MARGQNKKRNNTRKPFWERLLGWVLSGLRRLFLPAFAIWLIAWLWLGGVFGTIQDAAWQKMIDISANQGFLVKDIIIEGRYKTDMDALRKAVKIKPKDPLLSVNVEDMQDRIVKLPWIKDARVMRSFDGVLTVNLIERIPFAIWVRPGKKKIIIDQDGDIIASAKPDQFSELITIKGVGAADHLHGLFKLLMAEKENVAQFVTAAMWVGDRRWDLITTNKTRIALPEKDTEYAVSRLAKLQEEKNILNQPLVLIDLRMPDRIIIESTKGKAQNLMTLSGHTI